MTGIGEFGLRIVQNKCCFASGSAKSIDSEESTCTDSDCIDRGCICAVVSKDLKYNIATYDHDQIIDLMVSPYAQAMSHPAEK